MADSTVKSNIHVDRVEVTLSDIDDIKGLHVESFELVAAINTIPYIQLDLIPSSIKGDTKSKISVSTINIDTITELYTKLCEKANSRYTGTPTTGTIEISINSGNIDVNNINCSQSIKLTDWILTDVSISHLSSNSSIVLTVVFKHRIETLDRIGEIYETPKYTDIATRLKRDEGIKKSKDMVELLSRTYDFVTDNKKMEYYITPKYNKRLEKFRENIRKNLPSEYLETDFDVFLDGNTKDYIGRIREILRVAIATGISNGFRSSIWLTIIQELCPSCLMQIIPTYDQNKLRLVPCSPWKSPEYTLDSRKIESVSLSTQDSDPICGISYLAQSPDYPYNTDNNAFRLPEDGIYSYRNSFYIPDDTKEGRLELIGENRVLMALRALNSSKLKNPTGRSGTDAGTQSLNDTLSRESYYNLSTAIAEASFGCLYRRTCSARVNSTLSFNDISGKLIYPGMTLSVPLSNGNSPILNGYLSKMILYGSSSGNCTSTYDLIYCRPPGNRSSLVPEGTLNNCFKPKMK